MQLDSGSAADVCWEVTCSDSCLTYAISTLREDCVLIHVILVGVFGNAFVMYVCCQTMRSTSGCGLRILASTFVCWWSFWCHHWQTFVMADSSMRILVVQRRKKGLVSGYQRNDWCLGCSPLEWLWRLARRRTTRLRLWEQVQYSKLRSSTRQQQAGLEHTSPQVILYRSNWDSGPDMILATIGEHLYLDCEGYHVPHAVSTWLKKSRMLPRILRLHQGHLRGF